MENISKFLFLFFVLAVFLTACAKTPTETTQTTTAVTPKETPASVSETESKEILTGLLKNKVKTFMVNYEVSGAGEFTSMAMYSKGSNFRYDTLSEGKKNSVFIIDNKLYSCSSDPEMCVSFGEGEAPSTGTEEIEKNIEGYKITAKPSRTVAGQKAKCFGVSNDQADVEICYSNEGIPLYSKTTSDGQEMEMIATKYSTSVDDSVFELPAEPQDMSAYMQQYQTEE